MMIASRTVRMWNKCKQEDERGSPALEKQQKQTNQKHTSKNIKATSKSKVAAGRLIMNQTLETSEQCEHN